MCTSWRSCGKAAWNFTKKHKVAIAVTAAGFIPGVATAVWAYRAYRIVQAARAAEGMAGGIRATRATTWLAGRMWTGAGARTTPVGRISADGLRQYRGPAFKSKLGRVQANFESRPGPSGKWTNNFHVDLM